MIDIPPTILSSIFETVVVITDNIDIKGSLLLSSFIIKENTSYQLSYSIIDQ